MSTSLHKLAAAVTIDGKDFAISQLRITLRNNVIPVVRLVVDPFSTDTIQRVQSADRVLEQMALLGKYKGKSASLSLTVQTVSAAVPSTERVSLSGWRVTDVGLSSFQRGSISTMMELQHPISALDVPWTGALADLASGDTLVVNGGAPTNWLASYQAAAKLIQARLRLAYASDTAVSEILGRLTQALDALPEYVEMPSTSTFPKLAEAGVDGRDFVKLLVQSIRAQGNTGSLWSNLIMLSSVAHQLVLRPRYWMDKLLLEPMAPWGTTAYTVDAKDISDISKPALDPAPCAGVRVNVSALSEPFWPAGYTRATERHNIPSSRKDKLYLNPLDTSGAILTVSPPDWLGAAHRSLYKDLAGQLSGFTAAPETSVQRAQQEAQLVKLEDELRKAWDAGAERFAKSEFLLRYRQQSEVTFTTPLRLFLPSHQTEPVMPGARISVVGDGYLFSFWCTEIEHIVDVPAARAYTRWSGSYVHNAGEPTDLQFVKLPTPNPLYS